MHIAEDGRAYQAQLSKETEAKTMTDNWQWQIEGPYCEIGDREAKIETWIGALRQFMAGYIFPDGFCRVAWFERVALSKEDLQTAARQAIDEAWTNRMQDFFGRGRTWGNRGVRE